jgi:hypothetical protein
VVSGDSTPYGRTLRAPSRNIWNEFPVLVTFESNWELAKERLREIADERGGQFTRPPSARSWPRAGTS